MIGSLPLQDMLQTLLILGLETKFEIFHGNVAHLHYILCSVAGHGYYVNLCLLRRFVVLGGMKQKPFRGISYVRNRENSVYVHLTFLALI